MEHDLKMEDLQEVVVPTSETTTEDEQDPLKEELEKVQKKDGRTELEKAAFSLKKNAERLKELGGDPSSILGVEKDDVEEDDKPVTMGMLKKLQQETASKTAVQLAEAIGNETERELTKYHLENSIKSTGNPQEDFRLAQAIVNSVRNAKIIEESARKPEAKNHSSASGADKKHIPQEEITAQEQMFMKQFGLTKEEVIKARG